MYNKRIEDSGKTALHIATAVGKVKVLKLILSKCPECWEAIDYTRRNILHIAAYMERRWMIKFIFKMSWLSQLINQKDNEGNTPLHLLAISDRKNRALEHVHQGIGILPIQQSTFSILPTQISLHLTPILSIIISIFIKYYMKYYSIALYLFSLPGVGN
ncbi:hypothetical protein RHGRI_017876 [Rhododendron griersonianum]|uniref:Ankyrin repeat protein n=1 Tax=Rhododendron griersonianum TaxID=479676 RepID=A0AAV6JZH2_9ERIC|nr:hypothetical protein RHGRI_017876 [Rhododendron griersonianum]